MEPWHWGLLRTPLPRTRGCWLCAGRAGGVPEQGVISWHLGRRPRGELQATALGAGVPMSFPPHRQEQPRALAVIGWVWFAFLGVALTRLRRPAGGSC